MQLRVEKTVQSYVFLSTLSTFHQKIFFTFSSAVKIENIMKTLDELQAYRGSSREEL